MSEPTDSAAAASSTSNSETKGDKVPDTNTVDNDDSINLDIGEEEKLLAEDEVHNLFFYLHIKLAFNLVNCS